MNNEETHTLVCSDCNCEIQNNEAYEIEDERGETRTLCESCYNHYNTCASCGCQVYENDCIYSNDGDCYCENCYHNTFTTCENCGYEIAYDYANYYNNCYYCDDCYNDLDTYDDYIIKSYHNRDIPITFKYLDNELVNGLTKDDLIYYGFELEIENKECKDNNEMANEIRNKYRYLELVFEYDGSLNNGFEIISQPMTMAYIKEHKNDIKEILDLLKENGFASHDTNTCGLHIHFSRVAFKDNEDKNIQKLELFFETFKNEIKTFSRRTRFNYCAFLSDMNITDLKNNDKYFKSGTILKDYYYDYRGHSIAINTQNANTLELRIFKGTLKYETFMATLEFANNLVLSIKNKPTRKISFTNVINYQETEYLKRYCEEKNIYNSTYLNDETKNVFKELDNKRLAVNEKNKTCKNVIIDLTKQLTKIVLELNNKLSDIDTLDFTNNDIRATYETLYNLNCYINSTINTINSSSYFRDLDTSRDIKDCYRNYLSLETNNTNATRKIDDLLSDLRYIECDSDTKEKLKDIRNQLTNIMNNLNNGIEVEQ